MIKAHEPLTESFRRSLRGVGSSVMIVSTELATVRYGVLATAVMSLTFEPPSLAVAINQSASIHDPLCKRGAFVLNILSKWNQDVAQGFMMSEGEYRFRYGAWSHQESDDADVDKLPYLVNAQASISCRLSSSLRSGTHTLLLGEVLGVQGINDCAPLLYCDGSYGSFAPAKSGTSDIESSRLGKEVVAG